MSEKRESAPLPDVQTRTSTCRGVRFSDRGDLWLLKIWTEGEALIRNVVQFGLKAFH